jgi:hypothetical protein
MQIPYSNQWSPELIELYEAGELSKNYLVYNDVINNQIKKCITYDPDGTFADEQVRVTAVPYVAKSDEAELIKWQPNTSGIGISDNWDYVTLKFLETGAMLDNASDPSARANPLHVFNLIREFIFSDFIPPEEPDPYDSGAVAMHWSNERWTANDRGYGKRRDAMDPSSLIRAATPGTDPQGGQALGMYAVSEFLADAGTTYGMFVRDQVWFNVGSRQNIVSNAEQTRTMINVSSGDATFYLENRIKLKAIVIAYSVALTTSAYFTVGDMTWAIDKRDNDGEGWVPLLIGNTGSNELVITGGTYEESVQQKYVFPFNATVSAFQIRVRLISGSIDTIMYAGHLNTYYSYWRTSLVEDSNHEIGSGVDSRIREYLERGWSQAGLMVHINTTSLYTHLPYLEYNYDFMLNGRWEQNRIANYRINTSSSSSGQTEIIDINYAAENNRWVTPVNSSQASTLFPVSYQYSAGWSRYYPGADTYSGYVGGVYTSGSAAKPASIHENGIIEDPKIYPLDPNTPFIEVLGFAFVTQGTGVVDPNDFLDSTIDVLDSNKDPIATVLVTEVYRAFTDEEWETSQRLVANDCLFYRFNITSYPNAAYFTKWAPNKEGDTIYSSTKTGGYYETLPADEEALNNYIKSGFDPRRAGITYRSTKRYVSGNKYEYTGKMIPVIDNTKRESWDGFFKRMKRLRKLMKANAAHIRPETLVCSKVVPLAHDIPRNTVFIEVTVNDTSGNNYAGIKAPELRALRTPIHQLYGNHVKTKSEDLTGIQKLRGEVTVAKRPKVFRKPNGKITFRFRVIANTHPRVYPGKVAHYNVWHTTVISVNIADCMTVSDVQFIKTNILTKETEPNGIHEEVWHSEPGKVLLA